MKIETRREFLKDILFGTAGMLSAGLGGIILEGCAKPNSEQHYPGEAATLENIARAHYITELKKQQLITIPLDSIVTFALSQPSDRESTTGAFVIVPRDSNDGHEWNRVFYAPQYTVRYSRNELVGSSISVTPGKLIELIPTYTGERLWCLPGRDPEGKIVPDVAVLSYDYKDQNGDNTSVPQALNYYPSRAPRYRQERKPIRILFSSLPSSTDRLLQKRSATTAPVK